MPLNKAETLEIRAMIPKLAAHAKQLGMKPSSEPLPLPESRSGFKGKILMMDWPEAI